MTTAVIVIIILFALIGIAAFVVFRRSNNLETTNSNASPNEVYDSNGLALPPPGEKMIMMKWGGGELDESELPPGADMHGGDVQPNARGFVPPPTQHGPKSGSSL